MLFALVPLIGLKEGNETAMPTHGSEGTYVCPMRSGCCFNPGEDADGNAVVLAPHHTQTEHASASGCQGGRQTRLSVHKRRQLAPAAGQRRPPLRSPPVLGFCPILLSVHVCRPAVPRPCGHVCRADLAPKPAMLSAPCALRDLAGQYFAGSGAW
jgi:hypothetical protein